MNNQQAVKSFTHSDKDILTPIAKRAYQVLGSLAGLGLVGYGLTYILVMPTVSPGGFVPAANAPASGAPSWFGAALSAWILVYAFAFFPVNVFYTIKSSASSQASSGAHSSGAFILAGCLMALSSLLEIYNNLPALAKALYPGPLSPIPADVALYLRQVESIRYLAFDVAGFSLIYAAAFIYALLYFRTHRWLTYLIFGSILLFVANLPFLWLAPNLAIILMSVSIFALVPLPIFQAKMAAG